MNIKFVTVIIVFFLSVGNSFAKDQFGLNCHKKPSEDPVVQTLTFEGQFDGLIFVFDPGLTFDQISKGQGEGTLTLVNQTDPRSTEPESKGKFRWQNYQNPTSYQLLPTVPPPIEEGATAISVTFPSLPQVRSQATIAQYRYVALPADDEPGEERGKFHALLSDILNLECDLKQLQN